MQVGTKEFYDVLVNFERNYSNCILEKADRVFWDDGLVYQNIDTNALYLAYRTGYALGRAKYMNGGYYE